MKTRSRLVKGSSFTCGNTKTAHGKSRASSVTTTTPQPSNGGLCALRGFNVAAESNWKGDASEKQPHPCKPPKDGPSAGFWMGGGVFRLEIDSTVRRIQPKTHPRISQIRKDAALRITVSDIRMILFPVAQSYLLVPHLLLIRAIRSTPMPSLK